MAVHFCGVVFAIIHPRMGYPVLVVVGDGGSGCGTREIDYTATRHKTHKDLHIECPPIIRYVPAPHAGSPSRCPKSTLLFGSFGADRRPPLFASGRGERGVICFRILKRYGIRYNRLSARPWAFFWLRPVRLGTMSKKKKKKN